MFLYIIVWFLSVLSVVPLERVEGGGGWISRNKSFHGYIFLYIDDKSLTKPSHMIHVHPPPPKPPNTKIMCNSVTKQSLEIFI